MMKRLSGIKFYHSLLILALTSFLWVTFFHGIHDPYFLFLHDEYLPFPGKDIENAFFIISNNDLGTPNTISLIVTFLDRLYYGFIYLFDADYFEAQKLLYFIKILIILILPYIGFSKFINFIYGLSKYYVVMMLSLFYAFNTFSLIYWHGNAFSLTLIICYSLAPFAFYLWEKYIINCNDIHYEKFILLSRILLLSLISIVMSFALYLYAAFIVLIFTYTLIRLFYCHKSIILKIILRVILLGIFCIPLFSIQLITLYEMLFLSQTAQNTIGGETNINIQGGLLYMGMMWFTWPIYTYWSPRNLYSFWQYFHLPSSIAAPFLLYGLILIGTIRQRKNILTLCLVATLLLMLLLVKGPQEPFGEFYNFLLVNVPGFRVFRSPDTKFGFVIVLLLAFLLALSAKGVSKRLFIIVLSLVVLAQGWPIFSGVAIRGENKLTSRDRIVYIPNEYWELANYLNDSTRKYGYVYSIPGNEFGKFNLPLDEEHTGQDLIRKITNLPFLSANDFSGIPRDVFENLLIIKKSEKYEGLRKYGVRYFLIRNDFGGNTADRTQLGPLKKYLDSHFQVTFQNSIFKVYEDKKAPELLTGGELRVLFRSPSQVSFKISSENAGETIVQRSNYSDNWRLYFSEHRDIVGGSVFPSILNDWINSISYVWKKPVLDSTHTLELGFANGWDLRQIAKKSTDNQRSMGEINLEIYYWPQSLFAFLLAITSIFSILYLLAIIAIRFKSCRR